MPRYTVEKGCVGLGRVLVIGEEIEASEVQASLLVMSGRLSKIAEPEPEPEPEPEEEKAEESPKRRGRRETATAGKDREKSVDE